MHVTLGYNYHVGTYKGGGEEGGGWNPAPSTFPASSGQVRSKLFLFRPFFLLNSLLPTTPPPTHHLMQTNTTQKQPDPSISCPTPFRLPSLFSTLPLPFTPFTPPSSLAPHPPFYPTRVTAITVFFVSFSSYFFFLSLCAASVRRERSSNNDRLNAPSLRCFRVLS